MKKYAIWICSGISFCLLSYLFGCGGSGGGGGSGPPPVTHAVSGTIFAANNSAIDSDVNDTLTTPVSNDTFATAQDLPNPVILGGYVNETGTGAEGHFYDADDDSVAGDLQDYYSVSLTDSQSITLSIADDADIDLYLYDDTQTEVDSSVGISSTESVSPPAPGNYFIEVRAYRDASNYILVVGQPVTAATVKDPRMDEEFMPGHVIVAFEEDSPAIDSGSKMLGQASYRSMNHKAMKQGSIRLFEFTPDNKQQVFKDLNISPPESNRALYQTGDPNQQLKLDTLRVIDALNRDPQIRFAEPNYFRHPLFVPNDPDYYKQWHYPLINLPQAWEVTKGQDVIVAVIDTGILSQHPDIDSQLTTDGYDFISVDSIANDTDPGIDNNPEDPGDEMTGGSSFHGTHVAGTVAAASNNAVGVAGVAYESKIMALRALGVGGGLSSDIMECMKYAAGLPNDSSTVPSQVADVINMSLGGGSPSQAEQTIVDQVRDVGVIIVAAAGNENTNTLSYPASYDGVISVSAVGPDKSLASYSNFGSKIDVAAPGGDFDASGDGVYSTSGDDTSEGRAIDYVYSFSRGTSMASPHMAGVVALMKAVYPDSATEPFDDFLMTSLAQGIITEDLAGNGLAVPDDQFGYGLIDAYKAVITAADPTTIPTFLVVNQNSLNFGNATDHLTIKATASNDNNPLSIQGVSDDASWLDVTVDDVDVDNLGDYLVTVDRGTPPDALPNGPYYATITFDSTQNDVEVSVIMYQGVVSVVGDSGFHYVLLLDATTFRPMYQDNVAVSNGEYAYYFPSVAEGNYIVYAGTDSDSDLYIGDSGEATGAYISLDQPAIIEVNQDLIDIDFNTDFNLNISADQLAAGIRSESGFKRLEAE
jgi:serine protease